MSGTDKAVVHSLDTSMIHTELDASIHQEASNDEEGLSLMDLSIEDIMDLTFETLEDAESFYSKYSRYNGFEIRVRDGTTRMKRWVCCREGKRRERPNTIIFVRKERPETRCHCLAGLKVTLNHSSNKWEVSRFVKEHSHFTVAKNMVHLLRHHRNITPADMALINAMRGVGIRPCHIYRLMVELNGGAANVGYTNKDMLNMIDKTKRDAVKHGDVMTTLAYFDEKKKRDPGFEYQYTTMEGDVLNNLFWCDSRSKIDYDCFGDLVMFDSTFGTNIYGRSLVLFIGVNNHHQTCIFGCGLINSETLENYEWLLHKSLAAMGGKMPRSLMTDSDNAMRTAISRVFPGRPHQLCSWHLLRNAHQNIP